MQMYDELACAQAALKKFLTTTKKKMVAQSKSHKRPSGQEVDEEFERRKEQWQVRCEFLIYITFFKFSYGRVFIVDF